MATPPKTRFRRSAFTLIELLVVISIIVILASLIFGVGPGMISRGKQVSSLNNMRQIAAGLNNYANDNDNRFPKRPTNGDGTERWPYILNREYGIAVKCYADPGDIDNYLRAKLDPISNDENNTSYIVNGGSDDEFANPDHPITRSSVEKPSETILVATVWRRDPNFFMDISEGNEDIIKTDLYGHGSNYVFMDGSARFIDADEYKKLNQQNVDGRSVKSYLWRISKTPRESGGGS